MMKIAFVGKGGSGKTTFSALCRIIITYLKTGNTSQNLPHLREDSREAAGGSLSATGDIVYNS
jgi:CO dehydrogenase maturation factor